jgi:pimeloyl-ACP methyl ester carboxylesterase
MASKIIDRFWHKSLKRPYQLKRALDAGSGDPVMLLHGIGRTGDTWQHVVELIGHNHRIVAFDLLGFGASPKPDWINYSTDDHVKAVAASIKKLKLDKPVILVGHSMGCLVAVRLARQYPELVKHLVLYEMPLYDGLPDKRIYRLRTDLYYRFYKRVTRYQPSFNAENMRLAQRLAKRIIGFEVDEQTWQPFIKSLEHTIMLQTAAEDIKQIRIPMDVIYGKRDMLVIRGKPQKFFGDDSGHITAHTIRERHVISTKAAQFIAERIEASGEIDKQYNVG